MKAFRKKRSTHAHIFIKQWTRMHARTHTRTYHDNNKELTTLTFSLKNYGTWYGVQVLLGDVIYIEANSGAVKRVGRSDAYSTEYDLEAEEYVPLPKGDVHKKKEIVQDVTLHDLDAANAKPQGGNDIVSMMG